MASAIGKSTEHLLCSCYEDGKEIPNSWPTKHILKLDIKKTFAFLEEKTGTKHKKHEVTKIWVEIEINLNNYFCQG